MFYRKQINSGLLLIQLHSYFIKICNVLTEQESKTPLNMRMANILIIKRLKKGVVRKTAKAATVNVKFSLEAARSSSTLIPKGTRVSNDSDIYFETQNSEEIAAGNTDIVISAYAPKPERSAIIFK